ncbi:MAG TPA: cytidine deaminase [Longimicrobiaceae bacterium]
MTEPAAGAAAPLAPGVARDLLERARAARTRAYAPYSHFPVGAALLAVDGRIFTGVNVENAAYGLCTCAERTAFVRAVAEGASAFSAIAIAGADDGVPCPPCGSCRQILHELAPDLVVITDDESGAPRSTSLRELLPSAFGPGALPPRQKHA